MHASIEVKHLSIGYNEAELNSQRGEWPVRHFRLSLTLLSRQLSQMVGLCRHIAHRIVILSLGNP